MEISLALVLSVFNCGFSITVSCRNKVENRQALSLTKIDCYVDKGCKGTTVNRALYLNEPLCRLKMTLSTI